MFLLAGYVRQQGSKDQETAISSNPVNPEPLAELNKTVTPVTSAVQWPLKNLDSGSRTGHFRDRPRRNDVEGLLQEALLSIVSKILIFPPLRSLRWNMNYLNRRAFLESARKWKAQCLFPLR